MNNLLMCCLSRAQIEGTVTVNGVPLSCFINRDGGLLNGSLSAGENPAGEGKKEPTFFQNMSPHHHQWWTDIWLTNHKASFVPSPPPSSFALTLWPDENGLWVFCPSYQQSKTTLKARMSRRDALGWGCARVLWNDGVNAKLLSDFVFFASVILINCSPTFQPKPAVMETRCCWDVRSDVVTRLQPTCSV